MPSDFLGQVSGETHPVGSVTGVVIPLSTIFEGFFNFFSGFYVLSCVHAALGVLRGAHICILSWHISCSVKTGWECMF